MKPYGYMNAYADGRKEFHYGIDNASVSNIPLYTAPRELSDEEIEDLADKYLSVNYKYGEDIYVLGEVEFARAILKKASEK